jgi:hypothetical protein
MEEGRLGQALEGIERLTSSTARFAGYEVVVRELDEPTHQQIGRILKHAATHLESDAFMREFLTEVMDLSLDDRLVVPAILQAAASIQSDDTECDVLTLLLGRSDGPAESTAAAVVSAAARDIQSDAVMARLLKDFVWASLASDAGIAALHQALASMESDGPLRDALAMLFNFGSDCAPAELVEGLRVARTRIQSEDVRTSALWELPNEALHDASVLAAWRETVATIEDPEHLTDLLVHVVITKDASPPVVLAAIELLRGHAMGDWRLADLLRAIPAASLHDAAVHAAARATAEKLSLPQDRAALLARLDGIDPDG